MASNIESGEIVQLRSGGPLMTTYGKSTNGIVDAIYYNSFTGLFERMNFDVRAVRLANTSPEVPADAGKMRASSVVKSTLS